MVANTAAPMGLVFARNRISSAPTFQTTIAAIKRAYGSDIGIGDLVITGTGAQQGYVNLSVGNEIAQYGVFAGITSLQNNIGGAAGDGYYDINTQSYQYGLNGAYKSTMLTAVGVDIGARVIDDPFAVFRAQMVGGAWANSLRGENITFTAATNGAPNASGISTLSLDYTSIGTSNQLPFRILGVVGAPGGPQDPGNTNPWIEVSLNTAEMLQGTGI